MRPIRRFLKNFNPDKDDLADDVVITGGTIDGTAIGGTTPAAASVTTLTLGAVLIGSTAAEIDTVADVSAYQEAIIAAGALSVTKKISKLALVGAGAVTLAAPSAALDGQLKLITMTADNGDVTLALTNVVGQSSGTTATFNDVSDQLVLLADFTAAKWTVIKERGISLA